MIFLDNYELLGRKLHLVMPGSTGAEKLNTLRTALGSSHLPTELEEDDGKMPWGWEEEVDQEKRERWDCETFLSTYSNLENHPRLIRARDNQPVPRIQLDPRTGLPSVGEALPAKGYKDKARVIAENGEGKEEKPHGVTISRPRHETKEDKKARKTAVKAERQTRRIDKKKLKEQFGAEVRYQLKGIATKEGAKTRKL